MENRISQEKIVSVYVERPVAGGLGSRTFFRLTRLQFSTLGFLHVFYTKYKSVADELILLIAVIVHL